MRRLQPHLVRYARKGYHFKQKTEIGVLYMRLAIRLRRSVTALRYRFVPTEELIARVGQRAGENAKHSLIEILKERLAHQDGSLEGVDWSRLRLNKVTLSASKLGGARFTGADLTGAYFGYCDLRAANFEAADLREAHFREADLSAASFAGANLAGANLARANLQRCSFVGADLTGANLWGADLRGADFCGAKLTDCRVPAAEMAESAALSGSRGRQVAGVATDEVVNQA